MSALTPDVAVIAGVGPGLGAASAHKFANEGCRIALLARSSDYLEALSDELRGTGTQTLAVPTDTGEADHVVGAFRRIHEQLGPVDLLINNASAGGRNSANRPYVDDNSSRGLEAQSH